MVQSVGYERAPAFQVHKTEISYVVEQSDAGFKNFESAARECVHRFARFRSNGKSFLLGPSLRLPVRRRSSKLCQRAHLIRYNPSRNKSPKLFSVVLSTSPRGDPGLSIADRCFTLNLRERFLHGQILLQKRLRGKMTILSLQHKVTAALSEVGLYGRQERC